MSRSVPKGTRSTDGRMKLGVGLQCVALCPGGSNKSSRYAHLCDNAFTVLKDNSPLSLVKTASLVV